MDPTWLDDRGAFLCPRCPLPLDAPFTPAQAYTLGVSRRALQHMKQAGLIRRVIHGVYAASQAPDDTLVRASSLALVVPPTAVVTDRTAAWLHGVDILPRTALTQAPPIDIVHVDDTRVRRPEVDGRRRGLIPSDITVIHGVRATTACRTALDLGRLLWRYDALAAIDGFLRIGVPHDILVAEIGRFRGYRGVIQLRRLAPLGDPRSESVGESALRLHWHDAGLPEPEPQYWIYSDDGVPIYRLDLAEPDALYAAEYNGEEFHTEDEDREYDEARAGWLGRERDWTIDPFTKREVYGRDLTPVPQLQAGYAEARRHRKLWTPHRRTG
ncbi:MAG: hypothetical protein JWR90_3603 [Marmoricola sp.]|jgi:hypothetical protein|nr:hypothetical protein [Marmoricola sp.]